MLLSEEPVLGGLCGIFVCLELLKLRRFGDVQGKHTPTPIDLGAGYLLTHPPVIRLRTQLQDLNVSHSKNPKQVNKYLLNKCLNDVSKKKIKVL